MKKHMELNVSGLVQGVGFRPFLHRLANKYKISGRVRNTPEGLSAALEGEAENLTDFMNALRSSPPPLSFISDIHFVFTQSLAGYSDFMIADSSLENHGGYTLAGADVAPCGSCLKELFDPSDRRYGYAFINCTDCGPRYSIIRSLPYDRQHTSMAEFKMCQKCQDEYDDIKSRRYHAQPNCCPDCGPQVFFSDRNGRKISGDPFKNARDLISRGGILAVKGTGGIHLACDASDIKAVKTLRQRKKRPAKPLALMAPDIETVKKICEVSEYEEALLSSPSRPVVLLEKKSGFNEILSFDKRLGIMLPYSPLHYLLTDRLLVMTSANESGCPVLTDNEPALKALSGIADGFLLHDRIIENRCDDSVVRAVNEPASKKQRIYFMRRSRGYAPLPVSTKADLSGIFAFGAEQKASFCLGRNSNAFPGPHIGDLKNIETFEHYAKSMDTYRRLFNIAPSFAVCDLHPDYFSTRAAEDFSGKFGIPLIRVQHHHAHMASCMADNRLDGPVFGIIWDGTGLGEDGGIWGGEFLKGGFSHYKRLGSIRPVRLPGGDAAIQNPDRIALSLLYDAGLSKDFSGALLPETKDGVRQTVYAMLSADINSPKASSIGRLFDGVYSLLSGMKKITFDGEAAMRLEALSENEFPSEKELSEGPPWNVGFYEENGVRIFDTRPLIKHIVSEIINGAPASETAEKFMLTLCHMALCQTVSLNPEKLPVVLSGGVFLNAYLLNGISKLLSLSGYRTYIHNRVSANDEGLSLGQIMIAASRRGGNGEK